MNILDKTIAFISPSSGLKRAVQRAAFDDFEKRKYQGAGKGRRFGDNSSSITSENLEISQSLKMLRKRSKDLYKNYPYSNNAVRKLSNNIIGTGIICTINHKSPSKTKIIQSLWNTWAESVDCDFDGLLNFYGLQALGVKSIIKNGECFVRRVWKDNYEKNTIPFELQLLDPDLLDFDKTEPEDKDGNYVLNGVKFNKRGKRIGYWFYTRHPSEKATKSIYVDKTDLAHGFDVNDPGQILGVPHISPSILRMLDFDEYEDAEIMKKKVAACFAAFITNPDSDLSSDTEDSIEKITPGMIKELRPGQQVQFAIPPTDTGYSQFTKQSLAAQAAGIGMSYEGYTGDLSNVNFSSARMGYLEYQRHVEVLQWNIIIPQILNSIFKWFAEGLALTSVGVTKDLSVSWTVPRREMIDPLKETQAKIKQIRAGLISWQDAVRELGYMPDELLLQMEEDKENFDKVGIMPESDPRYDADKLNALENGTESSKQEV